MESPISKSKDTSSSKKSKSSSSSFKHKSRHRSSSSSSDEEKEKSTSHSSTTNKRRNHSSDSSNDSEHDDRKKLSSSNNKKLKKSNSKKSESSKDQGEEIGANSGGGGDLTLSIEETNKLRAKLGLKPLTANDNKPVTKQEDKTKPEKKTYIDKNTNQEFEHVPAKNIADIREQKEFKQKLEEQKEKRRLAAKFRQTKGIADEASDNEDESADVWLKKLKEKEEAAKKAKLLEEMDEQFGINDAVETKKQQKVKKETKNDYSSNHLKGLRVEHDQSKFKEGQEVILTLKDKNIIRGLGENLELDEDDDGDVLVNVNILDDETAAKNIENKKKKPDYKPYDDFDDEGNFREKSLLDKYDEELDGEKKKSFRLGTKGVYDVSDEKFIKKLDEEHKARAIKLDILNEIKLASDYMTQAEMEKFKKPKKVRKVLRKSKALKADDLLPLPNEVVKQEIKTETKSLVKQEKESDRNKKVSLKDIDFGFKDKNKSDESSDEGEIRDEDDEEMKNSDESDEDDINVNKLYEENADDLKEILEEENQVLEELHTVLSKTRKKITNSIFNKNILEMNNEEEVVEKKENDGVSFDNLNTINEENDDGKETLTLDTISEFCRNIRTEHDDRIRDRDDEEEEEEDERSFKAKSRNDEDEDREDKSSEDQSDMEVETEEKMKKKTAAESEDEGLAILDEEPIIDRGIASALKLAVNKGYLAKEKDNQNARLAKSNIQAQNYTIEERNYYDIDDKYNRNRDKYSGPLSDFDEKKNYKPDIKLNYFNEKGHEMNEKEAFRYLSHKFHGKGPGKKKTEKRLNKTKESEAMNKMSSIDTPLNTVALLVEKQKKLQQPYVVLSAQKGKQDQVTLHKR